MLHFLVLESVLNSVEVKTIEYDTVNYCRSPFTFGWTGNRYVAV